MELKHKGLCNFMHLDIRQLQHSPFFSLSNIMNVIWSQIWLEIRRKSYWKRIQIGSRKFGVSAVILIWIDIDALDTKTKWMEFRSKDLFRLCIQSYPHQCGNCCRTAIWLIFTCGSIVLNTACALCAKPNKIKPWRFATGLAKTVYYVSMQIDCFGLTVSSLCLFIFVELNEEKMQNSFPHTKSIMEKLLAL